MITFKQKGSFKNTESFLSKSIKLSSNYSQILKNYAEQGLAALAEATPVDSGETARSWGYKITNNSKGIKIIWTNSHIVDGVPIAVLIQYGHATGNGGYVQGRDYINPVIQPLFDKIANDIWREVTKI